ncbi:MAG: Xaa-Pro peptidase family protein [Actinomycetota bacterium]|nr:Xaa-Pro peptidase family protein [Actinomycetota bacterium]
MTSLSSDPLPDVGRMQSERLMLLQQHMADQGVVGAILLHGPHVAYATGYVSPAVDSTHAVHERAVAIVGLEGSAHLFANDPPPNLIAKAHPPLSPELDESIPDLADALRMMTHGRDRPRVAIDELTGAMLRSGLFDDFDTVDASRVLGPARLLKTEDELACIDQAQRINEIAMEEVRGHCVPGTRRSQLAAVFANRVRELGVEGILIDPIFQPMPKDRSDPPRTSTGHVAFPTGVGDPTFAEGDVVWVDTGIDVEGYASDYGRTWVVGRAPNQAEQTLFTRWSAVMEASLTAIRPGATLAEVARAATKADGGVRPWLPHFYLSHGVGVESAEMPMIGTDLGDPFDEHFTLEAGMVLVLEPVTWEDGVGGYRAEEIVAVTEDGWRPLGGWPGYSPFDP